MSHSDEEGERRRQKKEPEKMSPRDRLYAEKPRTTKDGFEDQRSQHRTGRVLLIARRAARRAALDARLASLERDAEKATDKLKRLYAMVEDGIAEMDDLLKDRITILKLTATGRRKL